MLCHRKIIVGFDLYYLVAVRAETVEVDAQRLRIAADIDDLIDSVSAEHSDCLVVYSCSRRVNYYHVRLLRDLIKFLFYVAANVVAIGDPI